MFMTSAGYLKWFLYVGIFENRLETSTCSTSWRQIHQLCFLPCFNFFLFFIIILKSKIWSKGLYFDMKFCPYIIVEYHHAVCRVNWYNWFSLYLMVLACLLSLIYMPFILNSGWLNQGFPLSDVDGHLSIPLGKNDQALN